MLSVPAGQPLSCRPGSRHRSATMRFGDGHVGGEASTGASLPPHALEQTTPSAAQRTTIVVDAIRAGPDYGFDASIYELRAISRSQNAMPLESSGVLG